MYHILKKRNTSETKLPSLQCGVSFEPSFYFAWPRAKFSGVPLSASANPSDAERPPPPAEKASSPAGKASPPPGKPDRPPKPPPLIQLPRDSSLFYASRVLIDGVIRPSQTRKVGVEGGGAGEWGMWCGGEMTLGNQYSQYHGDRRQISKWVRMVRRWY